MPSPSGRRTVVVTGDVILELRLAKAKITERNSDDDPLVDPRSYIQLSSEPGGAVILGEMIERVLSSEDVEIFAPRADKRKPAFHPAAFWRSFALCSQYRMSKGGAGDGKAVWRIDRRLGIDRGKRKAFVEMLQSPEGRREAAEASDCAKDIDGLELLRPVNSRGEYDPGIADLVIVEQGRNGFDERDYPLEEFPNDFWPLSLRDPVSLRDPLRRPWLLARWSRPGAPNAETLWKQAHEGFDGRIVAVINADHLRYIGARVTRNLSWERTVEDLFDEISAKWEKVFAGCRYLIVSLFPSGALLLEQTDGKQLRGKLIYDRDHLDSSWTAEYAGEMMGYTRCITAAVAVAMIRALPSAVTTKGLVEGITAGLVAARQLLVHGFQAEEFQRAKDERRGTSLPERLLFPVEDVGDVIAACMSANGSAASKRRPAENECGAAADRSADDESGWKMSEEDLARDAFARPVDFEPPNRSGGSWSILSAVLPEHEILGHARGVIEWGRRFKDDKVRFPLFRVGKLIVIDRVEMEGLRAVQSLMADYVRAPFVSKPLSIAVFGPSGAGKSFAIRELARGLAGDEWPGEPQVKALAFNLSQFVQPSSLSSALQQVRDVGLAGKTALVFWDEFDTHFQIELGWLRYFLAPMHDGRFQDGLMTYNVGRAIFVFAGSQFPSQQHFAEAVAEELGPLELGRQRRRYARAADDAPRAKSPDFMSRLLGFVDVPTLDHPLRGHVDSSVALRRAGLLRSFLRQEGGERLLQYVREDEDEDEGDGEGEDADRSDARITREDRGDEPVPEKDRKRTDDRLRRRINVDTGVADAFLRVQRFKYNARSIEAIVKMSTLRDKDAYERSSLPPRAQLALHVDADEFLDLVAASTPLTATPAHPFRRTIRERRRKPFP